MQFLKKAEEAKEKYKNILDSLQNPEIVKDREKLIELSREKKTLEIIINASDEYNKIDKKIEEDKRLIEETEDQELLSLAKEEIQVLERKKEKLFQEIKKFMIPLDPDVNKNAVLEIRAGTGGEEAALFAADLLRMYNRYCEQQGWKFEIVEHNRTDMNGYKEAIVLISGENVYGKLKYESGVHRVQRVPETESGGRIHTSAVSIAVLPEIEEVEIDINPDDLKVDFFAASGPGGQHVNKASTAVRIEHLPSGIIVSCQDERSQYQNRVKAMKILRTRLYDMERSKKDKERKSVRKKMIGSGDRSEKIRTYNFPQNRITDHRINYTKYNLDSVMNGNLDNLIESLKGSEQEDLTLEAD